MISPPIHAIVKRKKPPMKVTRLCAVALLLTALTWSSSQGQNLAPVVQAADGRLPAARPVIHAPDASARSNFLARAGGVVLASPDGPAILILNTQKRVPEAAMREVAETIVRFLRLPCVCKSAPKLWQRPVADAESALADTNTAVVIVVCDVTGQPALLVAPESRWALVNIRALDAPGTDAATLATRARKEIWRAFGYAMGAANSNFEHCLLKPVFGPRDLDALRVNMICPEPFGKIMAQAQKMGLKMGRFATYRKAVEEGWAPAPTNDIQRAIWEECRGKK
jgi:hypothetical protein